MAETYDPNMYQQYTQQADPSQPQVGEKAPDGGYDSNMYQQYVNPPSDTPGVGGVTSDQGMANAVNKNPDWLSKVAMSGDAFRAPFDGIMHTVGNTALGAAQGVAQLADKAGLHNNIGQEISDIKASNDADSADFLKGRPVTNALEGAGDFAGNAAEFAALGGEKAAGYLKNAALGAAQGAAQPADTLMSRTAHTALGGAAGLVGKGVADGIGGALKWGSETIPPAVQKARDLVSQVFAHDGIDTEQLAQAMEKGQATNLPLTAVDHAQDVGQRGARNTLGMLDAAVNKPGDAAAQAAQLQDRVDGRGGRIRQMFDDLVSNSTSRDVSDAAFLAKKNEAAPAYQAAFAHNGVWNDGIEQGLQDPDIAAGVPEGMRQQRLEAYGSNTQFEPYDKSIMDWVSSIQKGEPSTLPTTLQKDPFTGQYRNAPVGTDAGTPDAVVNTLESKNAPNMRVLDAAKRGLDAKIAAETNPVTGEVSTLGRSLIQAKNRFVGSLDEANPLYADARQKFGSAAANESAAARGQNFMNQSPGQIQDFVKGNPVRDMEPATQAEHDSYLSGARTKLDDIADNMNDGSNFGKQLWKQNYQKRIQAMLPDDNGAFDAMNSLMGHEQNMANTDAVLGNSRTYSRQQYSNALDEAGANKLTQAAAKGLRAVGNPLRFAANVGSDLLHGSLKDSASEKTGDIASEVTKLLLSKDPNVIRSLANKPTSPEWLNAVPAMTQGVGEMPNE